MLKSLTLLSFMMSSALVSIDLPAIAASTATVSLPSAIFDLEKVPVKPVNGSRSISGIADGGELGEAEDSGAPSIKNSRGRARDVLTDDEHEREIEDDE